MKAARSKSAVPIVTTTVDSGRHFLPLMQPPAIALLVVNIGPLLGVVFWQWTLFHVVALYWLENVVIGAINVLKMAIASPDEETLQRIREEEAERRKRDEDRGTIALSTLSADTATTHHASKLLLVPFFVVHYGGFCLLHGIFVFTLLGGPDVIHLDRGIIGKMQSMVAEVLSGPTLFIGLAIVASHSFSFIYHYLGRGEFRRTDIGQLMFAPYGRVVILHVAGGAGVFAIALLGQPLLLVLLLIAGKTILDWHFHVRSHQALAAATSPTSGKP